MATVAQAGALLPSRASFYPIHRSKGDLGGARVGVGEATLHQGWDPFEITLTLMGARLLPRGTGSSLLLSQLPSLSLGLCWEQVLLSRNVLSSEEGDLRRVYNAWGTDARS